MRLSGRQSPHKENKIDRRDAAALIASLLLACGILITDKLTDSYTSVFRAVVSAKSEIPGRARTSLSPVTIEARCTATGLRLLHNRRQQRHKQLSVWFDPDVFKYEGDDMYSISAADLAAYVDKIFGQEVRMESALSDKVTFRFAAENYRKVPVHMVRSLSFKPQYMAAGEIRVKPDSVLIYGEEKYISAFERILTRPVELYNLSSSRTGTIQLEHPKGVRVSQESVSYELDVVRYVEVRRTVKLRASGVPAGHTLSIYPSTAELVIRTEFPSTGTPEQDIFPYIDYQDFNLSRNGRCVARIGGLSPAVLSCVCEPELFDCLENVQ